MSQKISRKTGNDFLSPQYHNQEINDSFSDIDESMARYNKRKGIQFKSKSRERSKSGKNSHEQLGRNTAYKNSTLTKSKTSLEELRNIKKHEEERKQNKIAQLLKSKGYQTKSKESFEKVDEHEAINVGLNSSSQLTSIEKESNELNDQSTIMKRLRRQMSTNYRKSSQNIERETDSYDVTQKNSSGGDRFTSKYRKRKVDTDEFLNEIVGKHLNTNKKEKQVQDSKDSIDLKEISYQISSADQTTNSRPDDKIPQNRFNTEVLEESKESTLSEDETSPDAILTKDRSKNVFAEGDNVYTQKHSNQDTEIFSRQTSKTQIQDCENTHQYEQLKFINVKRVQHEPQYDHCSYTETFSSEVNNRPSTILEADTCQEETANNFNSLVQDNKSLSPVTGLQIKQSQSNQQVKVINSHGFNTRKNSVPKKLDEMYSRTIDQSKSNQSLMNQFQNGTFPIPFNQITKEPQNQQENEYLNTQQELTGSGTYNRIDTEKSIPFTVKGSQNNIFN